MKKITLITITVLLYLNSSSSWSADFQEGLAAAKSGDFATALREWKPLAEQGNATAQAYLGALYLFGEGVKKDFEIAKKWTRLAAEKGNAEAQFNLSLMYGMGKGFIKNNVYSHMWASMSTSSGHKGGKKLMKIPETTMTPSQIETAKKLARECIRKKYKGCEESSSPQTTKKISENNIKKRLANLKKLLDAGLITKEEAAEKRKAILDSL